MEYSSEQMNTEYYAMRLVSEALSVPERYLAGSHKKCTVK